MLKKSGNGKKETKTSPWYVTLSTYYDEDYSDNEVTYSWFRRSSTTTDDLYDILEFDEDERDSQRKVTSTTRPATMIITTRTTTPFAPNDYFFYGYNHSTLLNTGSYNYYTYGPFNISTKFTVFNRSLNILNIYSDGYVKLLVNSFSYISIDPFYSSTDSTKNQKIYLGDIQDTEMLQLIGTDIRNLCKNGSFVPTWAYVITWYNSQPFRSYYTRNYAYSNFSNTFQLLLTSNGNESYAMFNYVRMDWPNEYVSSYFTSTYYYSFYGDSRNSYGQKVFESNSVRVNLTDNSNMGRPGRWFLSFNNTNCLFV